MVRGGVPVTREDVRLVSTAGYELAARLTRPAGADPLPGVVVSPAIHAGRKDLDAYSSPVTATEIARLGYAVLTYDPAGCGENWGEEDFGGPEHQDDLRVAIRHLAEHATRVGVLSLSLGAAAAVGALARYVELDVAWLVDWEGPSDRETITAGGTRMVPAGGHTLEDDTWWHPREAVRHAASLRCGYVRLQAVPDHAQPDELRHAERMMRAVERGALPWYQINDHPRGIVPPRPNWLAGGPWTANCAILAKLAALRP